MPTSLRAGTRRTQPALFQILAVGHEQDRLVLPGRAFERLQRRHQRGPEVRPAARDTERRRESGHHRHRLAIARQRNREPRFAREQHESESVALGALRELRDLLLGAREPVGPIVARQHRTGDVEADDEIHAALLDRAGALAPRRLQHRDGGEKRRHGEEPDAVRHAAVRRQNVRTRAQGRGKVRRAPPLQPPEQQHDERRGEQPGPRFGVQEGHGCTPSTVVPSNRLPSSSASANTSSGAKRSTIS
jgi:hypothetical protein